MTGFFLFSGVVVKINWFILEVKLHIFFRGNSDNVIKYQMYVCEEARSNIARLGERRCYTPPYFFLDKKMTFCRIKLMKKLPMHCIVLIKYSFVSILIRL